MLVPLMVDPLPFTLELKFVCHEISLVTIWISSSLTFCQSYLKQRTEAAEPVWSLYQVMNTIYTTNPTECPVLSSVTRHLTSSTWRTFDEHPTPSRIGGVHIAACFIICGLFFISALKIHVSPITKEILDQFGTFVLTLRGPVEMKVWYAENYK